MRRMPERVELKRLSDDYMLAGFETGDYARVALFVPARDRDRAPRDSFGTGLYEGIIVIVVEDQRFLWNHQGRAGASCHAHPRQHLRFELLSGVLNLTAQLERVGIGIEGGADPVDHARENVIGVGCRN